MQLYIHTCHAHTKTNDESAYIDSCKYNIGLRKIKRTYIRIVACVCVCVCVCARTLSHPVVSDSLQTLGLNSRETDFNFFPFGPIIYSKVFTMIIDYIYQKKKKKKLLDQMLH